MATTIPPAAHQHVNLESMLLCNNGLEITTREGMGRLAVASKDLKVLYERVIRERPLLVWTSDDWVEYITCFKRANVAAQSLILDMYHPPLEAPSVAGWRGVAERLACYGIHNKSDIGFIHKLLAIQATNAHQYYGEKQAALHGDLKQHERMGGMDTGAKYSALFVYGSKIAHSCHPNLNYTSQTDDGALEYKVIRPIAEGEAASFSYIGKLFQTPTWQRRKLLWNTKSFICNCTRCMGPDYCRYIKCTGCETAFLPCIYDTANDNNPTWTCKDCGVRLDIEAKEKSFLRRLQSLHVRSADQPLEPLQDLVVDASRCLSPVHCITIEALETVAQLSASKAASQEMMQRMIGMTVMGMTPRTGRRSRYLAYGKPSETFRRLAAEAGFKSVVSIECVAAGCPGCYDASAMGSSISATVLRHEPVYEAALKVFHACTDLMEIPERLRPTLATALVQRYLPSMRGLFSETDPDVQVIQDKLVHQQQEPLENQSYSTTVKIAASTSTETASETLPKPTKKKNRTSTKKKKGKR